MIPIASPMLGEEEKKAVLAVLDSGMLAQGTRVRAFEESFADYCGVEYAVATSSGTAALHLALLAHGIGPGDEVITSPFSFIATANAIRYVGAGPVFADIQPDTFNLDPEQVEQRITERTKAVLPVHLFGHPADMTRFTDIARRHRLALIEDAAQAHGAEVDGQKVGTFGTGCFSFYPTKNMTSAEGGIVTTNDPDIADKVRVLRNHGMRQRYFHESFGYNLRMSDVHAAIGLAQLAKLEKFNETRIANARYLTSKLQDVVTCPVVRPGVRHVFHQYTVRVPRDRGALLQSLRAVGIMCEVYYPIPIHRQRAYEELESFRESYPISETASADVLSLPIHPGLSHDDLEMIVSEVRKSLR